jgi:hypothetical protein
LYGIYFLFTQGDIAYNLQEWRFEEPKKGEKEKETASFNVGDRFMDIIEDVAAYVPYMVRLMLIMPRECYSLRHSNKTNKMWAPFLNLTQF